METYEQRRHYFRSNGKRRNRIRAALVAAQQGRCCWCGHHMSAVERSDSQATIEHMVPLTLGGTNDRSNLKAACWGCNTRRNTAALPPQWREVVWRPKEP